MSSHWKTEPGLPEELRAHPGMCVLPSCVAIVRFHFCFLFLELFCFGFYKSQVCGNPDLSAPCSLHISVSHMDKSHRMPNFFNSRSVGKHLWVQHIASTRANFMDKYCILSAPPPTMPTPTTNSGHSLRHSCVTGRPLNNPTMISKCPSERKAPRSLSIDD